MKELFSMARVYFFAELFIITSISCMSPTCRLSSNVHCAVRREISPCTCYGTYGYPLSSKKEINVVCEGMISFQQVVTALQGKFESNVQITLRICDSSLDDLPQLSFKQMGITIQKLWLAENNLSAIPESVFSGMGEAELVSLANHPLTTIPQNVLRLMPKLKTLGISKGVISRITTTDFMGLPLTNIVLSANNVSLIEENSFPSTVNKLHIGENKIRSLNGTLRRLTDLEWLFMNYNELDSLEGELPEVRPNKRMTMLHASYNRISSLPQELNYFAALDILSLGGNQIKYLGGAFANAKKLRYLELFHNRLERLDTEDFANLKNLEDVQLQFNFLTHLNKSLLPLKNLRRLNVSHNELTVFSPSEIRGLMKLNSADFSHNSISEISAKEVNCVEPSAKVDELYLQFNNLKTLEGSIGLQIIGITTLNISYNLLESIGPQGLEGLKELKNLDISHNRLLTLGDAAQTILGSLEELKASYNFITRLEQDFHGFPQLCWADMSYNQIEDISNSLLDRTQCMYHGVNMTLRIYLQGNHGICNPQITEKIIKIEGQRAVKMLTDCQHNNGTQIHTASSSLV